MAREADQSGCNCPLVRSPHELMKSMTCALEAGEEYHNDTCLSGDCSNCGDFKKSPFCDKCRQIATTITFMARKKVDYETKNATKSKFDFVSSSMTAEEFEAELREVWTGMRVKKGGTPPT